MPTESPTGGHDCEKGGECELLLSVAEDGPCRSTSFEKLYEIHWRRTVKWLWARTSSEGLAEDLAADAWLIVWSKAGQFKGGTDAQARAWIYRIVRNIFLDWLKRAAIRATVVRPLTEDERELQRGPGNQAIGPDQEAAAREFLRYLREWSIECIKSLEHETQRLIVSMWWQTQSPKGIRELLAASGGGSMPNISRAVKRFRECLRRKVAQGYPDGPPLELLGM